MPKPNFDRMEHNPIDKDKVTETPGTLAYPHTVGGVVIRPEDVGRVKANALSATNQQTELQLDQIREQIRLLAEQVERIEKRKQVSMLIYGAEMGFDPIIGHDYHLYRKKDGRLVLSMVKPTEWGRSMPYEHVASVRLLSDHTWDVKEV
jgi:hypothetical protein